MTTLSLLYVVLATGVTADWAPIDTHTDAVEYRLQVSASDLEAIAQGDTSELTSEVPSAAGPVRRVRIQFGREQLGASTRASQVYSVSKPVVPAAWESLPPADSDPQSRTAFQNPGFQNTEPLPFDRLREGFQEATAPLTEAGQDLSRRTSEGFRDFGDNVRQATENTLRGTSDALDRLIPTAGEENLSAPYNGPRVVPPAYQSRPTRQQPARTAQTDPRLTQPTNTQSAQQPTNGFQPSQFGNRQPAAPQSSFETNPQPRSDYDPYSGQATAPAGNFQNSDNIAKSFGRNSDQFASNPRSQDAYAPVPRGPLAPIGQANPPANAQNSTPTNNFARNEWGGNDNWDRNPAPPLNWPSQNPGYTQSASFGNNQPASFGNNQQAPPNYQQNQPAAPASGWNPQGAAPQFAADTTEETPETTEQEPQTATSSIMLDRLMIVVLTGLCFWAWHSYIDVRHKYRSVLRRNPGGYEHSLAA